MSVTAAVVYALIVVTYGGDVHYVDGLRSRAACEDVRSVALYGRTVAERHLDLAWDRLRRLDRDRRWRAEHPPREPATADERVLAKNGGMAWGYGPTGSMHAESGLIYDDPLTEGYLTAGFASPIDVKYARCIVSPPPVEAPPEEHRGAGKKRHR